MIKKERIVAKAKELAGGTSCGTCGARNSAPLIAEIYASDDTAQPPTLNLIRPGGCAIWIQRD